MPGDEPREMDTFLRMAREFPARTALFSFGLPAFAFLQLINGVVNEGSIPFIALFGALIVAYSLQLTRYHVAAYRRRTLTRRLLDD